MNNVKIDSEKVYIPNVRPVSWDTGEMCEFAAALVSALKKSSRRWRSVP